MTTVSLLEPWFNEGVLSGAAAADDLRREAAPRTAAEWRALARALRARGLPSDGGWCGGPLPVDPDDVLAAIRRGERDALDCAAADAEDTAAELETEERGDAGGGL